MNLQIENQPPFQDSLQFSGLNDKFIPQTQQNVISIAKNCLYNEDSLDQSSSPSPQNNQSQFLQIFNENQQNIIKDFMTTHPLQTQQKILTNLKQKLVKISEKVTENLQKIEKIIECNQNILYNHLEDYTKFQSQEFLSKKLKIHQNQNEIQVIDLDQENNQILDYFNDQVQAETAQFHEDIQTQLSNITSNISKQKPIYLQKIEENIQTFIDSFEKIQQNCQKDYIYYLNHSIQYNIFHISNKVEQNQISTSNQINPEQNNDDNKDGDDEEEQLQEGEYNQLKQFAVLKSLYNKSQSMEDRPKEYQYKPIHIQLASNQKSPRLIDDFKEKNGRQNAFFERDYSYNQQQQHQQIRSQSLKINKFQNSNQKVQLKIPFSQQKVQQQISPRNGDSYPDIFCSPFKLDFEKPAQSQQFQQQQEQKQFQFQNYGNKQQQQPLGSIKYVPKNVQLNLYQNKFSNTHSNTNINYVQS